MKRIYFLAPELGIATRVVDELLLARIEERHIHVLAKRGMPLGNLPEASLLQKTDFVPALLQGLAIGGLTGVIASLVAAVWPGGPVLAGGMVLAIALAGAGFGALMSSMIGSSVGSRRIRQFAGAMERGELLIMVDVPRRRVEEIEQIVTKHYPQAECSGTEPHIPAFP